MTRRTAADEAAETPPANPSAGGSYTVQPDGKLSRDEFTAEAAADDAQPAETAEPIDAD